MKIQVKKWLSQNKIHIDKLGRIVINDKKIVAAINSAASNQPPDIVKGMCNAKCI